MPHKQIGVAQHAAEMLSDAGVQNVRSVARLDRWKSTEIIKPYYRTDTVKVTQTDAEGSLGCQDYKSTFTIPPVGSHVRVVGSYVQDSATGCDWRGVRRKLAACACVQICRILATSSHTMPAGDSFSHQRPQRRPPRSDSRGIRPRRPERCQPPCDPRKASFEPFR
jgi:hypothetical protein